MPERHDVPSPCIDVCRMNERSGLCEGCLRTIDEIAAWSTLSNAAKWQVLKLLPKRREQRRPGPDEFVP